MFKLTTFILVKPTDPIHTEAMVAAKSITLKGNGWEAVFTCKRQARNLVFIPVTFSSSLMLTARVYSQREFILLASKAQSAVLEYAHGTDIQSFEFPPSADRNVEKHLDFRSMVDVLESEGWIKTRKTESYMAVDPRECRFTNRALDLIEGFKGEEGWYDVDCLGTSLCSDLTGNFLSVWNHVKGEKVTM